jgi:hypothetical protein
MPDRLWFRFDDIWPLAEHAFRLGQQLSHSTP